MKFLIFFKNTCIKIIPKLQCGHSQFLHSFSSIQLLTCIIAFEVILNSVALSLTDFSFVGTSWAVSSDSSSDRERWRAAPCLVISSLHVCRSSNLAASDLITFCISFFCDAIDSSNSSSSSSVAKHMMAITGDCNNACKFQGVRDISTAQKQTLHAQHKIQSSQYITLHFKTTNICDSCNWMNWFNFKRKNNFLKQKHWNITQAYAFNNWKLHTCELQFKE